MSQKKNVNAITAKNILIYDNTGNDKDTTFVVKLPIISTIFTIYCKLYASKIFIAENTKANIQYKG